MKITVTTEQPTDEQLIATITIPAADVTAAIKKAYKEVANKYSFQGFRRGHVPRAVIDGIVGREAVLAQATNELLNDLEPMVLEELDIVPIGRLSFGDKEPELAVEGKDYVIEGHLKLRPAPELKSYDPVEINMPPAGVTEAEIDAQLEQFTSWMVSYEDIEEERAVVEGDFVSLDVEDIENASMYVGTGRMAELNGRGIPAGLQEGIIGMTAGETKEISWTESHELDGETVEVKHAAKITLNAIRKQNKPEIDDAFAKTMGYDDLAGLRAAVSSELSVDKRAKLPELKEDRVVEAAAERLWLDEVSPEYVDQVYQEIGSDFLNRLQSQGADLDSWLKANNITMDTFLADLRSQATERARQSLALDAIARHLSFTASEEELEEEFKNANRAGQVELYRQQGLLPAIRDSIKRTKAVKWLAETAIVTIVDEFAERAAKAAEAAPAEDAPAAEPAEAAEPADALEAEVDAMMAEVVEAAEAAPEE